MIRLYVIDVKVWDYLCVEVFYMIVVLDIIYFFVLICNVCNRCMGYYIMFLLDNFDVLF